MDAKCLALIGHIMSCPLHCQVEMVRRKLDDLSLKFRTQPEEKTRLLVFNSPLLRSPPTRVSILHCSLGE